MQIRALLNAAGAGRELRVMLPMVTEVSEIAKAREISSTREVEHLAAHGHELPTRLMLGADDRGAGAAVRSSTR